MGHQPQLGRLFGFLVTGRSDLELPMKKASLAAFDAEADPSLGRSELKFYLPARLLEVLHLTDGYADLTGTSSVS